MLDGKFQLIIFDVDGTFYSLNDVVHANYQMQLDFFSEEMALNKSRVDRIFKENGILPYKSPDARSATEFFLKQGIDPEKWNQYRNNHKTIQNIKPEKSANQSLLYQYASYCKLALLSSNSIENVQGVLSWLKINPDLFEGIFCSSTPGIPQPFSKKTSVPFILKQLDCVADSVLAIGDRYESDIRPLVDLGGSGVLIHDPEELKEIYDDLVKGSLNNQKSRAYQFFGKNGEDLRDE